MCEKLAVILRTLHRELHQKVFVNSSEHVSRSCTQGFSIENPHQVFQQAVVENMVIPGQLSDQRCLIVWKLDRLDRSLQHLIEVIADLENRQIGFQSLTENIDTISPTGKLIFHVFGSLAEFERGLIRKRVKAGLAAAKNNDTRFGRPQALNELDKDMALAMFNGAATKIAIARHFNAASGGWNSSRH